MITYSVFRLAALRLGLSAGGSAAGIRAGEHPPAGGIAEVLERISVPSRGAVLIGRRETLGAEYGVLPARSNRVFSRGIG